MKKLVVAASAIATSAAGEFVAGTSDECKDLHDECAKWAGAGECERNLGYMRLYACRVSCSSCGLEVADVSPIAITDQNYMASESELAACAARIPQGRLRWGADRRAASEIGCSRDHNLGHEKKGSWEKTGLLKAAVRAAARNETITFYDTMAPGVPLFVAPRDRTMDDFLAESRELGWLCFRDAELVQENLRTLRATRGLIVSSGGTRLGVNRPDASASRYAINLVTIAGHPLAGEPRGKTHDEL